MSPLLNPYTIVRWSARNPWPARFFLVTAHMMLTLLAFKMGGWLFDLQIQVSSIFLWGSILLAVFLFLSYPSKKMGYQGFTWRKTCDGLLAVCTFLMVLHQSNQSLATGKAPLIQAFTSQSIASFAAPSVKPATTAKTKLKLKTRNFIGKWLERKFNKSAQKGKSPTPAEKALYTVLGIIGAVFLFYLVALAACSLSCNGAETAGTIVAIVGISGIIFLLVLLFRHLYKKRPEETAPAV